MSKIPCPECMSIKHLQNNEIQAKYLVKHYFVATGIQMSPHCADTWNVENLFEFKIQFY